MQRESQKSEQNFRQKSERSHRPDEDLRAFTTLCSTTPHTHHCVDSMQVCGVLQLLAEPSRISGRWLPTCFPLRARHATFHSWQNDGRLRAYSEAQRDVPRSAYVHLASAARPEENAHGEYLDVGDHSVDLQAEERHVQRAMPNVPRRSSAAAANGARPPECLRAEGDAP